MKKFFFWTFSLFVFFVLIFTKETNLPLKNNQVSAQTTQTSWYMAGANPQRTSWVSEEVRGQLKPVWYKTIEPYIPRKVQIITADNTLYISTSKGLYALDANTGNEKWVYATEMPLGHSPTYVNGVLYVGGFDHKIHAINASSGQLLWAYEATGDNNTPGAGFQTNPLVVNNIIYAGNRDGYMYAIYSNDHPQKGQLAWKYKTNGPILFSPAYKDAFDNKIYFVSNDAYAYALNAQTGTLAWKSTKLPGGGFHSFWPVIYQNQIHIVSSHNYRFGMLPSSNNGGIFDLQGLELQDLYSGMSDGTPIGSRNADGSMNASKILNYHENKPYRRTYLILDKNTGQEITYDFNGNGKPEYAPFTWFGTHGVITRNPPVVGNDNKIYLSSHYSANPFIAWGNAIGWVPGSSSFTTPTTRCLPMDEGAAFSAGGKIIYYRNAYDRVSGGFDYTIPNPRSDVCSGELNSSREWLYFDYNLNTQLPGVGDMYTNILGGVYRGNYGSKNGSYGEHGEQNPPIPYQGKLYINASNTIVAFAPNFNGTPTHQTMSTIKNTFTPANNNLTLAQLKNMLASEVQKILDAGHLRAGYLPVGLFENFSNDGYGEYLTDYFHHPSEILYVLSLAYPHLSTQQQDLVKTYLQSEYTNYAPYSYTHIGFKQGTSREAFQLPDDIEADRVQNGPDKSSFHSFSGWSFPPQMFYHLWKYALITNNAKSLFDQNRSRLDTTPPDNTYFGNYPYILNAWIAGYRGYLELEKLAGYTTSISTSIRFAEYNRLLNLRKSNFTKDVPSGQNGDFWALNSARNFMWLVPELADELNSNSTLSTNVAEAFNEYNYVSPYWFVSKFEAMYYEGNTRHLFDPWAL